MLTTELKKQLFRWEWILALGIIFLVRAAFVADQIHRSDPNFEKLYREYILQAADMEPEEQAAYVENEIEALSRICMAEEEMFRKYDLGEITPAQYQEYLEQNDRARLRLKPLELLQQKVNTIRELALAGDAARQEALAAREQGNGFAAFLAENRAAAADRIALPALAYDRGLEFFLRLSQIDVLVLLILLSTAAVFSEEYMRRMHTLILATALGKGRWVNAKTGAALILSLTAGTALIGVDLACAGSVFGLEGWNNGIQALPALSSSLMPFTFGQYFAYYVPARLLGIAAFTILTLYLSSRTGRSYAAAVCSLVLYLIGYAIMLLPQSCEVMLALSPAAWMQVHCISAVPLVFGPAWYWGLPILAPALCEGFTAVVFAAVHKSVRRSGEKIG